MAYVLPPSAPRLLAFALLAVLAAGCNDDVDPTVGADRAFSVYGYLDPTADRQALRVAPITPTIDADTARALDATVRSTDLATGAVTVWRDSLVTFSTGERGHVFLADVTPTPGGRVRVEVARSDGATTTAEVDVPPLATPTLLDPVATTSDLVYPVVVEGVPRVLGGRLVVRVEPAGSSPGAGPETELVVPASATVREEAPGRWVVRVPFVSAVSAFLASSGQTRQVRLVEARFEPFVATRAWDVPPGGFDLDEVSEPSRLTNVTGGFGFVGAGYRTAVRWVPSLSTQNSAGFATSGEPASVLVLNEVGLQPSQYVELYNPTDEPVPVGSYLLTATPSGGASSPPVVINAGLRVPARGFLAVPTAFALPQGTTVRFLTPGNAQLRTLDVTSATGAAVGRYPDGYAQRLPFGGPDIFVGVNAATPGAANRLPYLPPFAINEIYTAGGDGFVEVVVDPRSPFLPDNSMGISTDIGRVGVVVSRDTLVGNRAVASETGPGSSDPLQLVLTQEGGTVFLYGGGVGPGGEILQRVLDVRTYGLQDPLRSIGYLPDGPTGAWTLGLVPTRGAPNGGGRDGGGLARR